MKIIIIGLISFFFIFTNAFAYTPTKKDEVLLKVFNSKIDEIYKKNPEKIKNFFVLLKNLKEKKDKDSRSYYLFGKLIEHINSLLIQEKIILEKKGGGSILYLNEDGKKIKIDESPSRIENSEIVGEYLIYDWTSTGGMMKKIYSLKERKIVEKIIFGKLTDDKKYIYGYEESGYGPGSIVILDLSNLYVRNLGKELKIGENGVFLKYVKYDNYKINFVLANNNNNNNNFLKEYVYDIKSDKLMEVKK